MSKRTRWFISLLILAAGVLIGAPLSAAPTNVPKTPNQTIFESPDRKCEVIILVVNESSEFTLEVRDSAGHILFKKDYTSINQDGGLTLAQAQWTSDSQFFVYSTWHAGGHQADNSPTFAYSRLANKIIDLEDRLGYIDVSDFVLSPPDVIQTNVLDIKTQVTHDVTLRLSEMLAAH